MLVEQIPTAAMFERIAEEKRVEDLKGILIISYETAVSRGLQPLAALAAIIEWAAQECARLGEG